MFEAILVDRDGTILQSEDTALRIIRELLLSCGHRVNKSDVDWVVGMHESQYAGKFHEIYGVDEEWFFSQLTIRYEAQFDQIRLYENVCSFLRELSDIHVPSALVTSANRKSTDRFLARSEVINLFDFAITFDDVGEHKPHPMPYLAAAKRLDVAPPQCLVLEDSLPGVRSAKAAGMAVLAVNVDPDSEVCKLADFCALPDSNLSEINFKFAP